ncbi:MAG: hypothetical protein AAGL97_01705 [Pseudomonadota bacterium]
MQNSEISGQYATFWTWFSENADEITPIRDGPYPERQLDLILSSLHAVSDGLFFEIGTTKDGQAEFIVSAECNRDLFPVVFKLVSSAPDIAGWKFTALKPPMGPDYSYRDDVVEIDPHRLKMNLLYSEKTPLLGIRVAFDNYQPEHDERYITALWRMVETIAGEWLATEALGYVEARSELVEGVEVHEFADLEGIARAHLHNQGIRDPYGTPH